MKMEKNFEVNPELDEMREQFRMLTEKVEKQNIVTEQLMREVSKKKIQRFEFWRYFVLDIVLTLICVWGIVLMVLEGHPFWTSLSFIYIILIICVLTILHIRVTRRYLSRIDYDLSKYWDDVEKGLHRKTNWKAIYIVDLIIAPILIHSIFLFDYLISVNEIHFLGVHWLPYIIVLALVAFSGVMFSNKYNKLIYRIFK